MDRPTFIEPEWQIMPSSPAVAYRPSSYCRRLVLARAANQSLSDPFDDP